MTQLDDLILGGLIGGTEDRWKRARSEVAPQHLVGAHATLYEFGLRYYVMTGWPIDWPRFQDILDASHVPPDRRMLLEQEFTRHWGVDVNEGHFRYALKEIRGVRRDEAMVRSLSESLRVMMGQGREGKIGYEDARSLLAEGLTEIDRWFSPDSPEGDIRQDTDDVWLDYERAKTTGGMDVRMVRTGIQEIDQKIIGLRPGENMLVAGYSSHGKTTVLQNIVHNAVVVQRKNVLVLSNENQYAQYRARIYNRHTHHAPGQVGVQGGLRMNDLKTGSLTAEQEMVWRRVVEDFGTGDYGKLVVVQMPMNASVEWASNAMERWGEEMPLDLAVLDYIGRCGAITKRPARRDELNDSINHWKNALVGFRRGWGVPGITGYQTSRESMQKALASGYYDLSCLAETSEAERNADVVATVLKAEDVEGELTLQLPKNRDGATLEPTPLVADFASTLITSGRSQWR